MMVETAVDVTLLRHTVQYAHALIQMEVVVEQLAHKQQQALQILQQAQALQIQQQIQDATQDGLLMHIVMISITTWAAAMMAETVADVTLTRSTAQYADALIQMEAGVEQLAHLLQQQLIIQAP